MANEVQTAEMVLRGDEMTKDEAKAIVRAKYPNAVEIHKALGMDTSSVVIATRHGYAVGSDYGEDISTEAWLIAADGIQRGQ